MRRSAATALAAVALTLVPGRAMAQESCEYRVASVSKASRPAVGDCFGIGHSVELPRDAVVTMHRTSQQEAPLRLGPGPVKLLFKRGPAGLAALLTRGRVFAAGVRGESLEIRVERGDRFTKVFVHSSVEMGVDAQGQVWVKKIEGDIWLARAVKLKIGEAAGKTRRKPQDQYFDDIIELSDEEFNYSLVEDEFLDVDDCFDYFERQLAQDRRDGLGNEFLADGYRNLGECCLVDGNWDQAIDYFQRALAKDREFYGEMDPDVAEDHRALGDAYLERALEDAHPEQGSLDLAIQNFEKARSIDEALLEDDPEDWVAAFDLAEDLYLLSDAWSWAGDLQRAENYERQAELYERRAEELEARDDTWEEEDDSWEEEDSWESPDESWDGEEASGEGE